MRAIIATGHAHAFPGRVVAAIVALACALLLAVAPAVAGAADLRLATTYTLSDSGLLDALLPAFTRDTGIRVRPLVAGTGQTLKMAERGDADVVWSHSPVDEEKFVAAGFGTRRTVVMTNAFLLLGPRADPAGIAGMRDAAVAMRTIAAAKARFVSRADESGTHRKEMALWASAGVKPEGAWYIAAGVGMGATLRIADERAAYVLADEATFTAMKRRLDLAIVSAGDPRLLNVYAVLPVNPARVPGVDAQLAEEFVRWLTTGNGRAVIAAYKVGGDAVFRLPAH